VSGRAAAAGPEVPDPYLPDRVPGGLRVTRYDLELDYRVASNRLDARARVHATADGDRDRVSLDLVGLTVTGVLVDGRRPGRWSHRSGRLEIRLARPVPAGTPLVVDVQYGGRPGPRRGPWGEVGWEELTDGVIVAGQPDGAPWGSGEPDEDDPGPGVPAVEPPRRTGTVLALALLVVAAAALYPGVVLIALVPLVLLARTVGSVSEALARRRERVGARRSDGLRAVASSPWHLVRALVTLVPSLLVAASLAVIVLGFWWWLVGSGALEAGPLRADVDGPTGTAAAVLLAVATAAGLAALWWGPLARTTRTGARRVLGAVAPGRGGATAAVLLALVAAAVLVAFAATGSGVDWTPFAEPSLPTGS